MPSTLPPSPADALARARMLGTIQVHRRIDALRKGNRDALNAPAEPEEACHLCETLVKELKTAKTPEEQAEAFLRLRHRVYELYPRLGPVPPESPRELIPEGLAGYRPAELLRIFHRAEAEDRRLQDPDVDFGALADEAREMAESGADDPMFVTIEAEQALLDLHATPEARAESEEEATLLKYKVFRQLDQLGERAAREAEADGALPPEAPSDPDEPQEPWAADDQSWRGGPRR